MSINRALIRPKALGLIYRGPQMLLSPVPEKDGTIKGYRPPGGSIEFQEYAADTLVREFMEEFAAPLKDISFIGLFENIFSYLDQPCHELVFLYTAAFADESLYQREEFVMLDARPGDNPYIWLDPAARPAGTEIYPAGLLQQLQAAGRHSR